MTHNLLIVQVMLLNDSCTIQQYKQIYLQLGKDGRRDGVVENLYVPCLTVTS